MPCQCKTDQQKAKCKFWIGHEYGIVEKNKDGVSRIRTGCFPEIVLSWLCQLMMTDEVVAKSVVDFRNEVYKDTLTVAPILDALLSGKLAPNGLLENRDIKALPSPDTQE